MVLQIPRVGAISARVGEVINRITRHDEVIELKKAVDVCYDTFKQASLDVKVSKAEHVEAVDTRSTVQSQLNKLLQKKSDWKSADLDEFTALTRSEHSCLQHEKKCLERSKIAEVEAEEYLSQYTNAIRRRYQEESSIAERSRILSSYGTAFLIVTNTVIFVAGNITRRNAERHNQEEILGGIKEVLKAQRSAPVVEEQAGSSEALASASLRNDPAAESASQAAVEDDPGESRYEAAELLGSGRDTARSPDFEADEASSSSTKGSETRWPRMPGSVRVAGDRAAEWLDTDHGFVVASVSLIFLTVWAR